MPYRKAAPIEGPDQFWKKAIADLKSGIPISDVPEKWTPIAAQSLEERDIEALLVLEEAMRQLSNHNGYYGYYADLVKKAAAFWAEIFPEAYATLEGEKREKLVGAKLDFPHETAVFEKIYRFTVGAESVPGMIYNGTTMRAALNRVVAETAIAVRTDGYGRPLVSRRLVETLCDMDTEYTLEFVDRLMEGGAQ